MVLSERNSCKRNTKCCAEKKDKDKDREKEEVNVAPSTPSASPEEEEAVAKKVTYFTHRDVHTHTKKGLYVFLSTALFSSAEEKKEIAELSACSRST